MTIESLDKFECCGCSSCAQKCPKKAIKMVENEEGFLYPTIDKNKCIDCGLCSRVCPQLKKIKETINYPKAFAVRNKNSDELSKSSSGGFFSVLANYIIENGGIVYGAAYDSNLNVSHVKASTKEELAFIRSSKYTQSNINNSYKDAETELKNGKYVLFTGTPCQISGLKSYLITEYDKLITAEVLCHGVPSQKLFHKYIEYLDDKYNSKVIEYNFRSKDKKGWGHYGKVRTADGKTRYINPEFDPYYNNFLGCVTFRESCYTCHYTNYNRTSEFTMADYWGIHDFHPDFFKETGNSLVLINNIKAEKVLENIKKNIEIIETNLDMAASRNRNLIEPSKRPKRRDFVYNSIDAKKTINYIKEDLKYKVTIRMIIKAILPIWLKKSLKKFFRNLKGLIKR